MAPISPPRSRSSCHATHLPIATGQYLRLGPGVGARRDSSRQLGSMNASLITASQEAALA